MKKFDAEIVEVLNKECDGDHVHSVGMGVYDFQLSFGIIQCIQTKLKAVFYINHREYTWIGGPSNIPCGLLIGQIPSHFELPDLLVLRMCFRSGDFVEFYTEECDHETVIIDFGIRDGNITMDIF